MNQLITPLKRARRGQSTVEYTLICAFLLIVIVASVARFTDLPARIGDLLVHQLVFQLGQHWHGVLTYF
jgi:Flp pilus assembly pilin Flp